MLSPQWEGYPLYDLCYKKGGVRDFESSLQIMLEIRPSHKLRTRLICRVSNATTLEDEFNGSGMGVALMKRMNDEIFDLNLINEKIWMLLTCLRILVYSTGNFDVLN